MSIEFTPMTDEEARKAESNVFDEGTYPYLVISCEHTVSKKGNHMLAATLEVTTDVGKRRVRDWVMLSGNMAWQLKKFCESVGMSQAYASGKLDVDDIVGRSGMADFYIEQDEQYGDKNRVGKYLPMTGEAPPKQVTTNAHEELDASDIPF